MAPATLAHDDHEGGNRVSQYVLQLFKLADRDALGAITSRNRCMALGFLNFELDREVQAVYTHDDENYRLRLLSFMHSTELCFLRHSRKRVHLTVLDFRTMPCSIFESSSH